MHFPPPRWEMSGEKARVNQQVEMSDFPLENAILTPEKGRNSRFGTSYCRNKRRLLTLPVSTCLSQRYKPCEQVGLMSQMIPVGTVSSRRLCGNIWYIRAYATRFSLDIRFSYITVPATYANPIIGSKPVDEVDSSDVMDVLTPIWTVKSETAAGCASAWRPSSTGPSLKV